MKVRGLARKEERSHNQPAKGDVILGQVQSEGLILELEGRARRLNETLDALREKARQVASAAPSTTGGASNDNAGISRTDQKYIDDATAAYECKIARNSDPLRGGFRVQF